MEVEAVIDALAQFGYVRPKRISGSYYQICCPFHNNGDERRPSCGVLLKDEFRNGTLYKKGWFHCFACGYTGNLKQSVEKILRERNVSQNAADWIAQAIPGFEFDADVDPLVPEDTMEQITNRFAIDYLQRMQNLPSQSYISEEELASYRYTVPYMYERKLTDSVIAAYDIGYDSNWTPPGKSNKVPCITIPVRDKQGRTLFFCRRSIEGKLYNYPRDVVKPVFGLDMISPGTKSVIICESCINALTAVVYGYSAVALMGTGNSYQVQQLKELGVSEFVICCDGDDAGRKATRRLQKQLQSVAIVWAISMPDGKDLNDCSKEEFDKLYQDRS